MIDRLQTISQRDTLRLTFQEYLPIEKTRKDTSHLTVHLIHPPARALANEKSVSNEGIKRVSGMLKGNGNQVEATDLAGIMNYIDVLKDKLHHSNANVYGISMTTQQLPEVMEICNLIKTEKPDAKIILGGPGVTAAYTLKVNNNPRGNQMIETIEEISDVAVAGDGTGIFLAMHPDFQEKWVDASNAFSPYFIPRNEVRLYKPDQEVFNEGYNFTVPDKNGKLHKAFCLVDQEGCPKDCTFCSLRGRIDSVQTGKIVRQIGSDEAISRIEENFFKSIKKGEPETGVMFYDDERGLIPKYEKEFCDKFLKKRIEWAKTVPPEVRKDLGIETEIIDGEEAIVFAIRGFVRADTIDHDLATAMRKAGYSILLLGIESGDEEILEVMRKGVTKEEITQSINVIHNAGLSVKFLLTIGHPGETFESAYNTLIYAKENSKPGDQCDVCVITPLPGAEIFNTTTWDEKSQTWVHSRVIGDIEYSLYQINIDFTTPGAGAYKTYGGKEFEKHNTWTQRRNIKTGEILGGISAEELPILREEIDSKIREHLNLPPVEAIPLIIQQTETSMGQGKIIYRAPDSEAY